MSLDDWLARFAPAYKPDDEGGSDDGQSDGADTGSGEGEGKPSAADIKAGLQGGAFKSEEGSADKDANGSDGSDDGSDGADGAGDRPDYVPEKFWKDGQADIEGISKAYSKLETNFKKLKEEGSKAGPIPDDESGYLKDGIQLGDDVDRIRPIDNDDPALGVFRKVLFKYNIPTEVGNGIAIDFLTELNPHLEAMETPEQIIEGLGEQGAAVKEGAEVWMDSLYDDGTISADELAMMYDFFGSSAAGVRLLGKMRTLAGELPIPMGQPLGGGLWSVDEWRDAVGSDKYGDDPAYRREVDAMGEKLTAAGLTLQKDGAPHVRVRQPREMSVTRR